MCVEVKNAMSGIKRMWQQLWDVKGGTVSHLHWVINMHPY